MVIMGTTPEGEKELVGLMDGVRENAQSWRELLLDLKRRAGWRWAPRWRSPTARWSSLAGLEEVWPTTRGQRCWVSLSPNSEGRDAE